MIGELMHLLGVLRSRSTRISCSKAGNHQELPAIIREAAETCGGPCVDERRASRPKGPERSGVTCFEHA